MTMRRRTSKVPDNVTAILTADLHLSTRVPVARTDDYLAAQLAKLEWLKALQAKYGCPVIDGGDLFDHWKASPWLSAKAYEALPPMLTVPGNHDLPEHSLRRYDHSALHLLAATRKDITVMNSTKDDLDYYESRRREVVRIWAYPFGTFDHRKLPDIKLTKGTTNVLVLHEFVWPGLKPPWPDAPGYMAQALLRQVASRFDLVVTGDNHRAFVEYYEGTILVNPGSMMRSTADQATYRPRCYLYDSITHTATPVYYPIERGVVSDEHLVKAQARDERVAAYIENMNKQWVQGLSFKANLNAFFNANDTPRLVKELIWQQMEVEN